MQGSRFSTGVKNMEGLCSPDWGGGALQNLIGGLSQDIGEHLRGLKMIFLNISKIHEKYL